MSRSKGDWIAPENSNDWNREKIEAGERLFSLVLTEVAEAVDAALAQAPDAVRCHSSHEVGGIVAHALFETAVRQVLMVRMPVSATEFGKAAGLVFRVSCHHEEGTGDDHLH